MNRKSILLICPEPIRQCIQGIGIRFVEMSRILSTRHNVSLWVPNSDFPEHLPCATQQFPPSFTPSAFADKDVVILHGHVPRAYLEAFKYGNIPGKSHLVVDLYDPFLIENLRYTNILGEEIFYRDREVLFNQLLCGDFFLASSDIQRSFYLGIFTALGRLTPALYLQDSTLRNIMDVVPFGVVPISQDELTAIPGRLRRTVPGIGCDDMVVFFGGVYEWYDPDLLMSILVALVHDFPSLRVIFCRNPNQECTPQGKLALVENTAQRLGLLGRHVFILPWFPYEQRFAFFKDADLAICLHEPSFEVDLSLRTRILDYLNCAIPVLATSGGEGERLLERSGGGLVVPPYDADTLLRQLKMLLQDEKMRRLLGAKGREWVQRNMRWEEVLKPLIDYCDEPNHGHEAILSNGFLTNLLVGNRARDPGRRAMTQFGRFRSLVLNCLARSRRDKHTKLVRR